MKAVTATQRVIEDSKRAAINAAPPPPGLMEAWKKPKDHFEAIRGKGDPPTEPPPREPGQDDDEHHDEATSSSTAALDHQAAELGMVRLSFETDHELANRIEARRALG